MENMDTDTSYGGMYLKVLLITDFAYPIKGGTERHVMDLARFLMENNVEVHILTPGWSEFNDLDIDGIKIHRFKFPYIYNKLKKQLRVFFYFTNAYKLDKKYNFDIFHSFYIIPVLLSSTLVAKIRKKKSIVTFFEPEPLYSQHFIKKFLFKKIIGLSNHITALNSTLEKLLRKDFSNSKIVTITNWVDESFHPFKTKRRKEKTILFVGRICEQKGVHVLIKALPLIRKKVNCKLILVGPPWEKEKFVKLAKKYNVLKYIDFIGFVSDKELIKWYNQCDILVYPTIKKGGFGFTIVEAMACGKPIVGSDDMGIPEAVGDAGLVTQSGDEKDLAKGITDLLTNEYLYKKCQKNAIKRVNKLFRRDMVLKKYLDVYERLKGGAKND